MIQFKQMALVVLALVTLMLSGCGGDIGRVSGTVTVNGEPISNATIMFYPQEGRASVGKTDESGKYSLTYTKGVTGAKIGTHVVTVSTEVFAEENRNVDYEETSRMPTVMGRKETMPPKYLDRTKSELTADVKSGSNTIDFDLTIE